MKKAVSTALAVTAVGLLAACGDVSITGPSGLPDFRTDPLEFPLAPAGAAATQSREVQGFNAVSISGIGTLYIEQTGFESLTVAAEERVLPDLITEVHGGRLTLGTRPGADLSTSVPVVYRLSVRELDEIDVSGVVRVEATGIAAGRLRVRLEGVTQLRAAGRADGQDVVIAGMSRYEAAGLESREAEVEVSDTGSALVRVSDRLAARVRGYGRVEYLGDPIVTSDVSGGGSVQRVGP